MPGLSQLRAHDALPFARFLQHSGPLPWPLCRHCLSASLLRAVTLCRPVTPPARSRLASDESPALGAVTLCRPVTPPARFHLASHLQVLVRTCAGRPFGGLGDARHVHVGCLAPPPLHTLIAWRRGGNATDVPGGPLPWRPALEVASWPSRARHKMTNSQAKGPKYPSCSRGLGPTINSPRTRCSLPALYTPLLRT